jgi:hypothetical protein
MDLLGWLWCLLSEIFTGALSPVWFLVSGWVDAGVTDPVSATVATAPSNIPEHTNGYGRNVFPMNSYNLWTLPSLAPASGY